MGVFWGAGKIKSCLDVCPGGRPRRLGVHASHSLGAVEATLQEDPQPPLPGPRAQLGGRGAPVQPDWEPVSLRPGQLFQKTSRQQKVVRPPPRARPWPGTHPSTYCQ